MTLVDLHAHTLASDGSDRPEELVAAAAAAGVATMAVTDHDTVAAVAEAGAAGDRLGVEVLAGCEVTATVGDRVVHVLLYGEGLLEPDLADAVEVPGGAGTSATRPSASGWSASAGRPRRRRRGRRGQRPVAGPLRPGDGRPGGGRRGRGLRPLPVVGAARVRARPERVADRRGRLAAKAGGVAVLAHPGRLADAERDRVVGEALEAGVDGVEVWHPARRRPAPVPGRPGRAPGPAGHRRVRLPRPAQAGRARRTGKDGNVTVPAELLDVLRDRLAPAVLDEEAPRRMTADQGGASPDDRAFSIAAAGTLLLAVATAVAISVASPGRPGRSSAPTRTTAPARPTGGSTPSPTWAAPSTSAAASPRSTGRPATGWPPATPPPATSCPGTPAPTGSSGPSRSPRRDQGVRGRGLHRGRRGGPRPGRRPQPDQRRRLLLSPYVNDSVKAITTSTTGSTVYVGGDFDSAEGAGRQRLAAFNATSGNISTTFKPNVSNGAGNFATVLSPSSAPTTRPSTSAATSPWSTAPRAATRPPCRPAWPPCGLEPGLHRRRRRRPHGLGLGEHGVRRAAPPAATSRPTAPPPAAARSGTSRPTATSRPWPCPPRSCTWAATSPPSPGPAAATWPP